LCLCGACVILLTMNKTLTEVIKDNMGYIYPEQLSALAQEVPALEICIKFSGPHGDGRLVRSVATAQATIDGLHATGDYIRDVFIPAFKYRELAADMGINISSL